MVGVYYLSDLGQRLAVMSAAAGHHPQNTSRDTQTAAQWGVMHAEYSDGRKQHYVQVM